MKFGSAIIAILGLTYFMPVMAEPPEMTTIWTVNYAGKPPFKRKMEKVRSMDLARFENQSTKVINTTDYRGKPPFTRNTETVRVVDLAQFEAIDDNKFIPTPRRMKLNRAK